MTPKEFKARYTNLKVKRANGTVETVRISKYVLNHSASFFNPVALQAFRTKFFSKGGVDRDLTIFTPAGEVVVAKALTKEEDKAAKQGVKVRIEVKDRQGGVKISAHDVDWGGIAVYCFLGKGAPEHYQVVLQLADAWGLAPAGLQAYADSCLGLDCNGFVGNFIWHGKTRHAWSKPGFKDLKGPDSLITNFFTGSTYVKSWEDIKPSNTYILGMVNRVGQIVPGGAGPAGHIMISQPGASARSDCYQPKIWVVESTAGAIQPGLTEGWYECKDYNAKTGIFTMDRGSEIQPPHREIHCKIVPLN